MKYQEAPIIRALAVQHLGCYEQGDKLLQGLHEDVEMQDRVADFANALGAAEPGPLLTFSLAYLDGVMEGEPTEVRKHWARVRAAVAGGPQ